MQLKVWRANQTRPPTFSYVGRRRGFADFSRYTFLECFLLNLLQLPYLFSSVIVRDQCSEMFLSFACDIASFPAASHVSHSIIVIHSSLFICL